MSIAAKDSRSAISLGQMLKANIRDYAMYIVLVVVFIVFGILTNGVFLSARNLTDLMNQTGCVAVLAIGMNLLGVDISIQYIVKGIIFVIAVAFDVISHKRAK